MLGFRRKKTGFFENILERNVLLPAEDSKQGMDFLVAFLGEIRPDHTKKKKNPDVNLQSAIRQLYEHKLILANLQHAFLSQLTQAKLTAALTQSGIPLARNFWQEFFSRIRHKILPPLQDENDLLYVLNVIFHKKNDYEWIEAIPRKTWIHFFEAIGFSFNAREGSLKEELLRSLKILSFQVAQLGLEKEVLDYLPENVKDRNSPFVLQNYKVHELESLLLWNEEKEAIISASVHLKNMIDQCYELIEHIREGYSEKGASLHQTYILLILTNRLERIQLLADALDTDGKFDMGRLVDIFRLLVRNEKRKNSIREFLSQSTGYLAYQIAEHKGAKGHKYITSTRTEYWWMIHSAMWGGFIVSFIAVFKNLLGKLQMAPFPLGFLYSVNYSIGFILIEETKSTLATKQPAFTASVVARSLDSRTMEGEPDLNNLAVTIARVSRSQIASFFGNLIIVFPLTYCLAWGFDLLFGYKLSEGDAAAKLLRDQHPWQSFALLYACFTGVFLFLSGIIAGYVQNKIQYGHIRKRLIKHPALHLSMSPKRLEKLASYIEKHSGAIIGNIALGFFLGFAGVMVKIIGIPFDIRHITIAAGNAAIGTYGIGIEHIDPWYLLTVFWGVIGIGFINFLVSFSLAFIVAVKSRGIHLSQYPQFFRILWKYFRRFPMDFIRPSARVHEPE
ncbi:MAG: site-specific recombinase [Chitinophagaceae bacterium]|nr:site-specific recombinase [Chitinophagaceae bacterium]